MRPRRQMDHSIQARLTEDFRTLDTHNVLLFRSAMRSIFAVSALAAFSLPAVAQDARIGRCHTDYCSWSREISRDLVGSSKRGTLIKVETVGGESHHKGGNYNRRAPIYNRRAPIRWNKQSHTTYVFCSKTIPAVMFLGNGDTQVSLLDIRRGGMIAGAEESSFSFYMGVCHNVDVNKQPHIEPDFWAGKFDYNADQNLPEDFETKIKIPSDILRF